MPYPTNPFTTVNPKELSKYANIRKRKAADDLGEALL
jgi:hypothetical protein